MNKKKTEITVKRKYRKGRTPVQAFASLILKDSYVSNKKDSIAIIKGKEYNTNNSTQSCLLNPPNKEE
ncbi:TPA: hypothetical protein ITS91_000563 [Enterococcus faecalis]|nr:hypothetical protein [Enterococcus faecalis]